ncbi:MAG: DoxX family protein [Candidatus Nomurabacteria bacterium]|nr:DoxX family protein [Candidatus Nomurabacteria bacterium]
MEILFIIGRLIVGIYFLNSGLNHFFKANYLAGYASSKGVPLAKAAVIISGATMAIGGISLIGWIAPIIGLGLLILTLIPLTTMMHNFWTVTDPMHRANEKINFTKNFALVGSLLLILSLFL